METLLTETCPACDGACCYTVGLSPVEHACECCRGLGQVEAGLVWCPCLEADEQGCAHCGGRMLVQAEAVPAIERAMAEEADELAELEREQAEDDRMARRGLHWSGVRFEGPA